MVANPGFDSGRFRTPADDAVSVLLEEGFGGKLASLAAGAAEEIAVDVVGDAGRFDIIVQTLIETMMARDVVLLASFIPWLGWVKFLMSSTRCSISRTPSS
jgi:hypothetical protein